MRCASSLRGTKIHFHFLCPPLGELEPQGNGQLANGHLAMATWQMASWRNGAWAEWAGGGGRGGAYCCGRGARKVEDVSLS